jgi:hypothetical protein
MSEDVACFENAWWVGWAKAKLYRTVMQEDLVMNRFRLLMILLAVFPLHAAAQSVFPFYQSEDVVFKPELLGKWVLEGEAPVEFRDAGNRTYGIILGGVGESDGHTIARAHLLYLGGKYFLDIQVVEIRYPKDEKDKSQNDGKISFDLKSEEILLTRSHALILINFSSDLKEFSGTLWKYDWLPKMAEQKKLKIPYLKDEMGRILLTANSSQLRKFVAKLPKEAFSGESGTLKRASASGQKTEG